MNNVVTWVKPTMTDEEVVALFNKIIKEVNDLKITLEQQEAQIKHLKNKNIKY